MGIKVRSGSVWRNVTGIKVRSGSVWRTVRELRVRSGSVWRIIRLGHMDWEIISGGVPYNGVLWDGFMDGYPRFNFQSQYHGSLIPDDLKYRYVLGTGEFASVISGWEQPGSWRHYLLYFYNNWGTMTSVQNELDADYDFSLEALSTGWSYRVAFSSGDWSSDDGGAATKWVIIPSTNDYKRLTNETRYRFRIVKKGVS